MLVVLIVALLVLGPNRLPQAARSMGKAMAEFRRVTGGLQAEVRDAMSQLEHEVNRPGDPPVQHTQLPLGPAPEPPTDTPPPPSETA